MHLGHNAYAVKDLNKTIDFYCKGLGFKELFTIKNDAGDPWLLYIKVNEREFLEFFPSNEEFTTNGSFKHLCLHVDDIHKELDGIKSRGIVPDGPVTQGKDNNYQAWLTDPDGNRIELMQLTAEALQLRSDT